MTTFADHVGDYPMFFALLEAIDSQPGYFRPSKTASQEDCKHRVVPFAAQTGLVEDGKEALALCRCQPVANPHTMFFHSLHPPDSGREIGT